MSPITKAQQKATAKYESKSYDKILLRFPKGQKQIIQEHTESTGESVNGFVNRSIKETIERDKDKNN